MEWIISCVAEFDWNIMDEVRKLDNPEEAINFLYEGVEYNLEGGNDYYNESDYENQKTEWYSASKKERKKACKLYIDRYAD
jgi:hypothetical protein